MENSQNIPMRELEKLSGFSRATINFYIKEGLLPLPEKSAKNMAYYGHEFLQKLKLIQKLKDADFSISQMKQVLSSKKGLDINPLLETMRSVSKLLPFGPIDQPVTIGQIREFGLNDEMISKLIELSVIVPIDQGGTLFPPYSMTICKLAKYFLDFGIPLSVAKEVVGKMQELIAIEMQAFHQYIKEYVHGESLAEASHDKTVMECFENINTLLPLLHLQLLSCSEK